MLDTLPTKSRSQTETVFASLRADVLACRLRPGERLRIASLAEALGASPGAVREALSRLAAEGFVVAEAHKGFAVAPVSADDLRDLTSVRIEMEEECLRRAIAKGGVEWESAIVAAFHRLSRTPERVEGDEARISDNWASAHCAFHAALVVACDSPWRLRLRDLLYAQSERYRRLSTPVAPRQRDLEREHREIMEAVLDRDADETVRRMTDHLSTTADLVINLADPPERPDGI